MTTNKQRRETARRHLDKQLQHRQERSAARKRTTLIASIVGTIVVIAVVVGVMTVTANDTKPSATARSAAAAAAVSFRGVTVANPTDLTSAPVVTSTASAPPSGLLYKDLVVGTGTAATPASTVEVQYSGVLYKDGTAFDSSWSRGTAASFSLTQVVPGFTQGIGGTATIPPMKVGGRRIMILPAELGYGAQGQGSIPPNSPLVFVVDLTKVTG